VRDDLNPAGAEARPTPEPLNPACPPKPGGRRREPLTQNPEPLNLMLHKKPTAGIILAAGESIRFGKPKQLLKLNDKYLIEWVLDAALASHLEKMVLVLGYKHKKILAALREKARHPDLQVVINHNYKRGQSTSLQAGVKKIQDKFPSVMFLLGDQPMLDSETIDMLLEQFWLSDKDICVPIFEGKRGNPAIFSQKFYDHLAKITGDIGARNIIRNHPENVLESEIKNLLCFMDIDTQGDFDKLVELLK
jgi:molybdenum cofactor cytidylyltransferase